MDPAPRLHVRDGVLGDQRRADHVDTQYPLPIGDLGLLDADLREIGGVVDQNVDAAEACSSGGIRDLPGAVFLRDVGHRQNRLRAERDTF